MNFLLVFLFSFMAWSNTSFNLEDVNVTCGDSVICQQKTVRFKSLTGEYRSVVHLKDTLKVLASDGGYQSFTYELIDADGKKSLNIKFELKPVISDINIGFTDRNIEYDPNQLLSLREGDFFETQNLRDSVNGISKKLEGLGFPNNKHSHEIINEGTEVRINFIITLGEPRIFKSMRSNAKSKYIQKYLNRKFLGMYNKPFDVNKFKIYLDDARKELFKYGYYLLNLDFTPQYKSGRVTLDVQVFNEDIYAFEFRNLQREHRDVIHNLVVDLFRKYKRPLSEITISQAIKEHYRKKALLKVEVDIEIEKYKNKSEEIVELYRITLREDNKTRFTKVSFFGNNFFSTKKLKRMFDREAFELASINYYDEEYFAYFQEYLKNQYIQKGYVQVQVFDPVKILNPDKSIAKIEYNIQEGQRAYVRKIEFEGLPQEFEDDVLEKLVNKVNEPFNPIKMPDDIKTAASFLQEQGYYYAEVTNASEDIVRYNKTGTDTFIKFKIDPGPLVKLNRILYLGNNKTRKKVLSKKILLEKGDVITPAKTRDIENAISATGLFNSVSVTPLRHNSKNTTTDLLVRVQERDYGLLEIAPGFRTDLGLKLTGTITYQNIGGYNRSVTLRSQVNRRISQQTLDKARRDETKNFIEHNTSLTYNQGDIFDTSIDGAASLSYQTRRFYQFDADILRLNGTLTRDFTKRFQGSVRYQYEDIHQYNGIESEDNILNGQFRIGSITPGVIWDLRNSTVNPQKGAYFNISSEFANPFFLSQKTSDLTVNYYKLMSRNRFYIPFKNGTVAISVTGGVEENFEKGQKVVNGSEQTKGYIPPIKVFRLVGTDIIRGFTDSEMNRLPNGQSGLDISKARVDNKAYMALLKVEPRYMINDSLIGGVFYDAGRVFVNNLDLGELRDSVGVTFKILTPVGTLDFDYGIKLLRKKGPNGSLEDPGRFHVSIGFF